MRMLTVRSPSRLICYALVLWGGVSGCRPGSPELRGSPATASVQATLAMRVENEAVLLEATVRNTSVEPIWACMITHGSPREPEPFIYYAGSRTVALYWAIAFRPPGVFDEGDATGATVRRLSAGESLVLTQRLGYMTDENAPWGSLITPQSLPAPGARPSVAGVLFPVNEVVVIVGWWPSPGIDTWIGTWLDRSDTKGTVQRNRVWLGATTDFYLDNLGPTAFSTALAGNIARQEGLPGERFVTLAQTQHFAVAGPVGLPKPIVVRAQGYRLDGFPWE